MGIAIGIVLLWMLAFFPLSLVPGMIAWAGYERLIKLQYLEQRAEWEADGMPTGISWAPQDMGYFDHLATRGKGFWNLAFLGNGEVPGSSEYKSLHAAFKKRALVYLVGSCFWLLLPVHAIPVVFGWYSLNVAIWSVG